MWCTTEDVYNDLASSGLPIVDIDSNYIVRGERPPPPCRPTEYDDDETLALRFGPQISASNCQDLPNAPDLAGIQQLLRMVNTSPDDSENITYQSPRKHKTPPVEKQCEVVISRLNPEVEEFVPKVLRTEQMQEKVINNASEGKVKQSTSPTQKNVINNATEGKVKLSTSPPQKNVINNATEGKVKQSTSPPQKNVINNATEGKVKQSTSPTQKNVINNASEEKVKQSTSPTQKNVINNASEGKVKQSTSPPQNKKDMVTALHKTIAEASQGTTLEKKRAKNVAIAALLKVHSKPSPPPVDIETTPVTTATVSNKPASPPLVLHTPEYFQKAAPKTEEPPEEISEPVPIFTPKEEPLTLSNPLIKESINKVQSWLEIPPAKPKPSGPFLGPVVFKKKDSSPTNGSPTSEVASSKRESGSSIRNYTPSKEAEEICKRMEKQAKEKKERDEKRKFDSMAWNERLEWELKKRDEEIRNRVKEASTSSTPSSRSPS